MTSPSHAPQTDASLADAKPQTAEEAEAAEPTRPEAAPAGKPAPNKPISSKPVSLPPEIGGAKGPEPTRYGDWQHKGRVTDF